MIFLKIPLCKGSEFRYDIRAHRVFNSETRFGSLLIPQGMETINVHRWRAWATPFMSRKCMEWLRTIRCPKSSIQLRDPFLIKNCFKTCNGNSPFAFHYLGNRKKLFYARYPSSGNILIFDQKILQGTYFL